MQNKTYQVPSWLQGWHIFDGYLQKMERGLLVLGIFAILIIGILHIFMRNFFGQGFSFSDVLSQHLTVWLGLLGATLATASSEHISIDAFSRVLKQRGLKINKLVIGAVATLGCGILTYRTIIFIAFYLNNKAVEYVHLGATKIPIWYFLYIFPYAFGLITLRYFMQTLETIYIPADQLRAEHTEADTVPAALQDDVSAAENPTPPEFEPSRKDRGEQP